MNCLIIYYFEKAETTSLQAIEETRPIECQICKVSSTKRKIRPVDQPKKIETASTGDEKVTLALAVKRTGRRLQEPDLVSRVQRCK